MGRGRAGGRGTREVPGSGDGFTQAAAAMSGTRLMLESVWDYPRPPRLERVRDRLRVVLARRVVAETVAGFRVLETSHAPTYYFPPDDVDEDALLTRDDMTVCEFKGLSRYFDVRAGRTIAKRAAWCYDDPTPGFAVIGGYLAFYASKMDECWVGDMRATPQPGAYYGGWVTPNIIGPFKGTPGATC